MNYFMAVREREREGGGGGGRERVGGREIYDASAQTIEA